MDDDDIWKLTHEEDLWIFDKLILSRKLGYQCGPVAMHVPKSGNYIVRPCVNMVGMSKGAYIDYIEENTDTDYLPAGFFWCEIFEGRHLSVDYDFGIQGLTTEGFRNTDDPLWKFNRWVRWASNCANNDSSFNFFNNCISSRKCNLFRLFKFNLYQWSR